MFHHCEKSWAKQELPETRGILLPFLQLRLMATGGAISR